MALDPKRRIKALSATFGLIILAVTLAFFAPEEKTLGSNIRLIYLHAAVTWVGLILFIASGLLGLLYFVGSIFPGEGSRFKNSMANWSSAGQTTATLFWVAHLTLGAIGAYIIWGGTWWDEPRLKIAALILLMAIVTLLIRLMVENKSLWAGLNLTFPILTYLLLWKTGKLFHPDNAFAASDSFSIKLFAALITLTFILVAITAMRLFFDIQQNQESKVQPDIGG